VGDSGVTRQLGVHDLTITLNMAAARRDAALELNARIVMRDGAKELQQSKYRLYRQALDAYTEAFMDPRIPSRITEALEAQMLKYLGDYDVLKQTVADHIVEIARLRSLARE